MKPKNPSGLLQNKVALVTGAGRGIGRVIALTFAREGADVSIASRTTSELKSVAKEIEALGRKALAVTADVSSEKAVHTLVMRTLTIFGRIDILVNNAADFVHVPVTEMSIKDFDRVIHTNLRGPFLLSRAVLPSMIDRKEGTIVMISSTSGKRANPESSAYNASKFGLMGFSEALLREVRQHNIRVVVVSPSAVDTRIAEDSRISKAGKGARLRSEDIAETVLYSVTLPTRALVREVEVWATNP
jgi:3-oxoacyl-[acyl-carrier protein] reductase